MEASLLTAFWLVSFSLVLVPGADWAYAISAGLRERAIAPAIAGMLSGYLAITVVVAAGVGALVARVPAVLLFLALLPQFTRATDAWSIPVQIGALGLLHMANCAVVYSAVGLGSKVVLRTRPSVARRVSQVSGAAMVVIAVLLCVEQLLAFR